MAAGASSFHQVDPRSWSVRAMGARLLYDLLLPLSRQGGPLASYPLCHGLRRVSRSTGVPSTLLALLCGEGLMNPMHSEQPSAYRGCSGR